MGNSSSIQIPQKAKKTSIKKVLAQARTGDLLLFAGIGKDSETIRSFGREQYWSHIGVVIIDNDGQKFLFESNKGKRPFDCYTEKYKDGVRSSDLKEKLEKYNGYFIGYRKLKISKKIRNSISFHNIMVDFVKEASPSDYTIGYEELVLSVDSNNYYETGQYFCVELVAKLYIKWGFLPNNKRANNYRLKDFSYFEPEGYLHLLHNVQLLPEVFIPINV
jgi:hypothetical protein